MSPVTVGVDAAGRAIVSSRETAYKTRHLRRDPRASLCAYLGRSTARGCRLTALRRFLPCRRHGTARRLLSPYCWRAC
jgi:hypothetical protein